MHRTYTSLTFLYNHLLHKYMRIPSLKKKTLHEKLFDPQKFKFQIKKDFNQISKEEFTGTTPSLFVGTYNYPSPRIGLLSTPSFEKNDNPMYWKKQGTSIQEIIRLRSNLVHAGTTTHIKLTESRFQKKLKELTQETAMAIKPVDIDLKFTKKPQFRLDLGNERLPHGPFTPLKKADLTANPKIPTSIYKAVDDTDLKAQGALSYLWKKGHDTYRLTKLLSASALGTKLERRFVPTRWSITAVDDTISKSLHKKTLDHNQHDFAAYFGSYQGNYFLVLMLPQAHSYELFEMYSGKKNIVQKFHTDYENVRGRKDYAQNTAGGYYAAKIAILEHLDSMKKQAGVLALRFITDEYWAPLGVWVVREAVRNTMLQKPLYFDSEELLLKYATLIAQKKFSYDITSIIKQSKLLKERKMQSTLGKFF